MNDPGRRTLGCGIAAKAKLERLIAGDEVRCFGLADSPDRYGRLIAVCHVWLKHNLNSEMVMSGYALAFRRYSLDYVVDENYARSKRLGIWGSRFDAPWDWRRGRHES